MPTLGDPPRGGLQLNLRTVVIGVAVVTVIAAIVKVVRSRKGFSGGWEEDSDVKQQGKDYTGGWDEDGDVRSKQPSQ